MTVETTHLRNTFAANGSQKIFTFTFQALATTDIVTYLDGVVIEGVTVILNEDQVANPGGTVEFADPPVANVTVKIQREIPYTQETAYAEYSAFPADTHEATADRTVMQIQQVIDGLGVLELLAAYLIYDFAAFIESPVGGAVCARWAVARTVVFPANLAGSRVNAGVAATADCVLTLKKNGVSAGTLTFTAGSATAVASVTNFSVDPGDILTVENQSTADVTLALVSLTISGQRSI